MFPFFSSAEESLNLFSLIASILLLLTTWIRFHDLLLTVSEGFQPLGTTETVLCIPIFFSEEEIEALSSRENFQMPTDQC